MGDHSPLVMSGLPAFSAPEYSWVICSRRIASSRSSGICAIFSTPDGRAAFWK